MIRAVRAGRRGKSVRQEKAGSGARKSEPSLRPGEREEKVVARIGPRGGALAEMAAAKLPQEAPKVLPWPAREPVFPSEGGPRSDQRNELNLRREPRKKRRGVWLCDKGDARHPGRGAQKRYRKR
jgi:hypothetical protein